MITTLLFLSLHASAIEYICWQIGDLPGMAFETSATNCPGSVKEKGSPTETLVMSKRIICTMPATCLALTPSVIQLLQSRFNKNIEEIKKLDSKDLLLPLANTGFAGRPSSIVCEGKGSIKRDRFGTLTLQDVKCPGFTACANTEEVFYNTSMAPMTLETSPTHVYGTSPMKSAPTKQ